MDIEKKTENCRQARRAFLKTAALAGAVSTVGTGAPAEGKILGGKPSAETKGLEYTETVIGMVRGLLAENPEKIAAHEEQKIELVIRQTTAPPK
jgi:hypothetical protein